MPEEEKGELRPENWLNPDYFEFTQPEYSAIMTSTTNVGAGQLGEEKFNDKVKREKYNKNNLIYLSIKILE
jgi:hypothetical protein